MTSETYLDLTFERNSKNMSGSGGGAGGVTLAVSSGSSNVNAPGANSSGVVVGSEKRPIRPKLLKLSDVTIPHRNRKKTKTKSKDRSVSSVRDRIYDDPAYTDDISHLANPMRRNSVNLVNSDMLTLSGAGVGGKHNSGGSSSLGKRSKLTKEFQKLAQEDIGHIAFSSSEEDLRYQRATSSRSEAIGRGRSLERSNAIIGEQMEKLEIKRRPEKRTSKQKRNLSLDNKRQQSQQETKENEEKERERDRPPEPPQRLALTRYNLGKQRSDEAAWQRQQSHQDFPPPAHDNEDIFSLHSSAKENQSVAASTSASLSNASTSKIQMGKRFLKGEIGIKSFNYYLLKEGLKSSKKFVEKQKSNFQSSTNNTLATISHSAGGAGGGGENTTSLTLGKSKLQANSEENIYEEIFFKDAPPSEEDDENQNPSNTTKQQASSTHHAATTAAEQNIMYADCELCMQQCDKPDCEYCLQPEITANVNQNRTVTQTFNNSNTKSNNTNNRLNAGNLNNNSSARTAMENQVNSAPILEFQSYNPNNPGVYKIETTPVAITGDYNPILQFQQPSTQQQQQPAPQHKHSHVQHQSTSTTSTATTTPSDHHLHQHHSQLQQQQQPQQSQQHQSVPSQQQQHQQFYGYKQPNFYTPHTQTGFWSQTSSVPRPRAYMVTGHFPSGVSSMQRVNTKSSSSSDSLQHQHKFNTFTHLDANFYNGSNLATVTGSSSVNNSYLPPQPLQPLMYAASRRLGGSQILVDNSNAMFENPSQIYKSDSRASILSEYSLSRSSDTYYGSQRYGHNRHYGTSHLNEHHNFENSLMSSYATAAQRRYFGSAESCRFGYDCRRCSLDSGPGAGLLTNPRVVNTATQNNGGTTAAAAATSSAEKCTFSDHCKYDCRNCDCSSVYFSSDFDEVYSGGGIPRKTAKGTLPSTGGQPPPPALENYDVATSSEKQQALKQNKYAQDFFKHVNDVKRSIYQAEMQRNGNMESMSPKKSMKKENRDKERDREIMGITTLPLAKERTTKPTPAPRTSLQQHPQLNPGQTTPQPLQRRLPAKSSEPCVERKEYASLDRLIASNKGAIPKSTNRISPHNSPKSRNTTATPRIFKDNVTVLGSLIEWSPTQRYTSTTAALTGHLC
ncbi:myb-like protein AA [Calliphora vicina]|uniref:myb-like protein AA n=1 Tax=Calliphora vicina TaxID=7373 RepID=UPI00325C00F7